MAVGHVPAKVRVEVELQDVHEANVDAVPLGRRLWRLCAAAAASSARVRLLLLEPLKLLLRFLKLPEDILDLLELLLLLVGWTLLLTFAPLPLMCLSRLSLCALILFTQLPLYVIDVCRLLVLSMTDAMRPALPWGSHLESDRRLAYLALRIFRAW